MKKKEQPVSFENALTELEAVVNRLEQGDLNLEDALAQFELGVNLAKQAQERLTNAEQRVQILLEKNTTASLSDYSANLEQTDEDSPF
ncbi:exodeoxyribonuclease VII small subunit [Gallibacterium salpingitidis]|uniref:Exodeoxyribonuclease 7 small subunit n=1 Tax=Gallibacterium salpingitidis TaxID=505341 RepID=A0A1A7NMN0_9PAST|nr:exodeoxyribonuclease VII small subunit [Gallibacterium salpingitidis]OBX06673.1 exodeoxyribonuclease VII small subunit [Gallibacterium salpingitidis]OBX07763.1 exodeoxyribonuclease VII small subunit [Gallibacterium salpingitidis]